MIKFISILIYRLKHDKTFGYVTMSVTILIGVQLANMLLMLLLGLHNVAWPWSFIVVINNGFKLPVFVAFTVVLFLLLAFFLFFLGGVKRAIAKSILFFWIAFIALSWLGVYVYIIWDGLKINPYPWLLYLLLLQSPVGSQSFNHLIISLMGSYSLFFFVVVCKMFSAKTKAEKVFGKAHFSNAFEIHRAGLFSDKGIILGKTYGKLLRLPGYEGVLVVAPMGGGKTTAIAIPNLLDWPGSGVFNDFKRELYLLTAKHRETILDNECYVWAPADAGQQSARYNPFFYVNSSPDLRVRDLQLIAEILIPATRMGDAFWYQSSREIFLTLSLYLFETDGMATLSKIHDISKQEGFFAWLECEVTAHEENFSKSLVQNAYAILGADEKTQKNILKDFHSRMSLFNDPIVGAATNYNDFDFRELRSKKISIYIQIPDSDKNRLSPILTLFWAQLINAMSTHEPGADEPYSVLALMDEFGNMARISKLKDGISFLRSYHVRCVIIVQYLAQIISIYGRDDAKGFLNSKVKVAFALNDIDDAKLFSKALGTKTVRVTSASSSTGHGSNPGSRSENINYQARALLHPDELMQLPDSKEVILLEAKSPIMAEKCYWFKEPALGKLIESI
jgi:type IV secretion system protein VirD4